VLLENTRFLKAEIINSFFIKEKSMKRFWLVLLSLGLIMAFSASAFAVDVKVSGEYYAAGLYLNKVRVKDTDDNLSTAFFFQRLRVGTEFVVSPSLKLVTRFDALERVWGGARSAAASGPVANTAYNSTAWDSAGTRAENENIAFDYAYIDYTSPIGQFKVGMMPFGTTGTVFADSGTPKTTIKYGYTSGPAAIYLGYTKVRDESLSAVNPGTTWTDGDADYYAVEGVYTFKDGKAGMKGSYYRYADYRPLNQSNYAVPYVAPAANKYNYKKAYFQFTPYVMAKIGPVNVQAELNWATGNAKQYDSINDVPVATDVKLDNLAGWVDATANFGMFYAGGTFAYVAGDDPNTTDRIEGGVITGGIDYNPCLILFNSDVTYWAGNVQGYDPLISSTSGLATQGVVNGPMVNAFFFQGRVGVKPTPQLDAMLSVSYAFADKKPAAVVVTSANVPQPTFGNGTYGLEVDLTGTYKITNNLSYMLGFGYLFTGDYFKGLNANSTNKVVDDYMLINKLTLSF